MKKKHRHDDENARHGRHADHNEPRHGKDANRNEQNPPRTTSHGWLTTPKFGSSTSGGGEIEPGPERD